MFHLEESFDVQRNQTSGMSKNLKVTSKYCCRFSVVEDTNDVFLGYESEVPCRKTKRRYTTDVSLLTTKYSSCTHLRFKMKVPTFECLSQQRPH